NIYGIYDVDDRVDLKGKTILLVDDIMTTGETLNNCALIMKIRGAEKVYCATAAITVKKKK
ncbi:MAG: phosphoribosyltransferase, partial [Clostridia bacterium]|nr:phosphoribosyltransferase [Clostridia bacterium]